MRWTWRLNVSHIDASERVFGLVRVDARGGAAASQRIISSATSIFPGTSSLLRSPARGPTTTMRSLLMSIHAFQWP